MNNINQTPKICIDSESPIKLLLGGQIRGATDTPNPPTFLLGGGEGGMTDGHFSDHQRVKYLWDLIDPKYH